MESRMRRWLGQFALNSLMAAKAIVSPVALGAHALLVNTKGEVLLVRHSYQRGWMLPGGGVNRAEHPDAAVMRELREELGAVRGNPPVFIGLYTRRTGWATNVIALYRVDEAEVEFRPGTEIREIVFVDPHNPPAGTAAGVARRLAEFCGKAPRSPIW